MDLFVADGELLMKEKSIPLPQQPLDNTNVVYIPAFLTKSGVNTCLAVRIP